jgi:uncharacterized protein YggE
MRDRRAAGRHAMKISGATRAVVRGALLALAVLLAGCGLAPADSAAPTAAAEPRTLTVFGSSLINAQPDVAVIQFGWWSKDMDAAAAILNGKTKRARLLVGLSALNISPDNLMAGSVSMSTEQVPGPDGYPTDQTLYAVNELFMLTVRDNAKLPGALDAIRQAAGAPYIFTQQVTYDLAPEARVELLRQAQAAAVADARANAERLAQALGLNLGEPQTVTVTLQQVVPQAALQAQVTLEVTYVVEAPK